MSDFSKQIGALSPEKRQLLLQRLNQKKEIVGSQTQIKPQSRESNCFPLSFAQERLWFLDQFQPNQPLYNEPTVLRLKGALNVVALVQTLNEILRRHEALRTTFCVLAGQPSQVIAPSLTLDLPIVDIQSLPPKERETEAQRLATEEAQLPFDLSQGPLVRVTLLKLGATEYLLLWTMHHIVCDGWSFGVIIRELMALYQSFAQGQPSPLPELPIQYADFALWQRQWLQKEVLDAQVSYWKRQLSNGPKLLDLMTDRPRPVVQSYSGARQSLVLSQPLTEALKALSQESKATLFMTLLAAFNTLLYRYSGQDDILVGTTISGRNRLEIEGLIGFFVNTLVMRTNLGGAVSFREILHRVREVSISAYAHQDLPFERLVEELQPERNLSHAPFFQVMFQLQNTPATTLDLPDLSLLLVESNRETARFDLALSMTDTKQGLMGVMEHNTDLFDVATITRMLGHFQTLLEGIVANPDQLISTLPLLTAAEEHQLLVEWNDTQTNYPLDKCIHQLFEEQVVRSPDAIAVVFEDKQLTYRELNQRANQLAHHLQQQGVGPEVLVGICVERSLEMVVGILAILKAGGAYLPLDPVYPPERLGFMLEDAQISVLLTQQQLVAGLPQHDAKVICLDSDENAIAQASQQNLNNLTTPDNLAYVIYTSGSTGKPKGVTIQHRSLVNYTHAACLHYGLQPSDRILQFASISFDAAAEEIFPCLTQGATLVLRTESMLSSIPDFLEKCSDWKLTVLDLPTAFWHQLTTELVEKDLPLPEQLRLVIIGGEKALSERLILWHKHVSKDVQLINSYGPTETTIVATISNLSQSTKLEVPIGKAIQNVQTYILDSCLQPTPIGVPGELYIGGVGVARGYLNRPELTAEKFILNPFNQNSGARLYKTGDLVRYLPNGEIQLLGRIDDQVKIRGFRIELGEIEAKLNQHPDVSQSVVLAWGDELGDQRLVAYIQYQSQQTPKVTELRSFLKEQLPQYMIPAAFVLLSTLPLLPNGKIDRRGLPAPEMMRPELEVGYVMPQTEVERTIAQIWQQALNIEKIGIHDNFFELGGHSLLMVKVNSQLREILQTDLSMLDMFRYPTISSLAENFSQSKKPTSTQQPRDIETDKILAGKAQQKSRLQKMKSMKNISLPNDL
ncbi:non-ribosomal peptide synthetase [Cylindrospermum sp. FACHB-282]|uniref:non-ribosomal peptide synthetase n=1 Tax=Cylindrospermum sp. FACHB-282 TaxID=2692794 RepID=UPI001682613D|nr:non-ribosomal peptide synthetase [Cylindrospermum sp. FACHB-282]MBD2385754.1 amino acid adenylation domain-containing protein [Cylindrospermum sp. FACHB-282]